MVQIRKSELTTLKNFFKLKGLGYEYLEKEFGYAPNTLRSTISRGGTDALLLKMRQLKITLFPDDSKEELSVLFPNSLGLRSGCEDVCNLLLEVQNKLILRQEDIILLKTENDLLKAENNKLNKLLNHLTASLSVGENI